MKNPATSVFLNWLADRLVHVYGESPNVDFVQRLRREADEVKALVEDEWNCCKNPSCHHQISLMVDAEYRSTR